MKKHTVMYLTALICMGVSLLVSLNKQHVEAESEVVEVTPIDPETIVEPQEEVKVEPETKPVAGPPKTYAEALAQAKVMKKNLLLVFYTDQCMFCKQLDSTLVDPKVQTALANYLLYKVNSTTEPAVASKFKVKHVPYYIVVDKETENVINSGSGYRRPERFINWLEN